MPDNFLHHLYLAPVAQSQGHGRFLLGKVLEELPRPVRLKCVISNQRACRFYETLGWRIESSTNEGPLGPYHNYILD